MEANKTNTVAALEASIRLSSLKRRTLEEEIRPEMLSRIYRLVEAQYGQRVVFSPECRPEVRLLTFSRAEDNVAVLEVRDHKLMVFVVRKLKWYPVSDVIIREIDSFAQAVLDAVNIPSTVLEKANALIGRKVGFFHKGQDADPRAFMTLTGLIGRDFGGSLTKEQDSLLFRMEDGAPLSLTKNCVTRLLRDEMYIFPGGGVRVELM